MKGLVLVYKPVYRLRITKNSTTGSNLISYLQRWIKLT